MVFFSCFLGAIGRPCHRVQKYWEKNYADQFCSLCHIMQGQGSIMQKGTIIQFL